MNAPVVFGPNRQRLSLGPRLGKGGEGEVYALADRPNQAVKVYTADPHSRQPKIAAMIEAGLARQTSLVAFPIEVVTDQRGKFVGFTMPRVSEHKPLHELYAPGARKAEFPKANYPFLVHTAANVARAVAAVHEAGCVIGDINHSGILVSDTATVALIDADSFQVATASARYLCRVGVPEYTPPELQGQSLDQVARTQDHDAFGLAVVIFQLLWMGKHPFAGRYSGGEMPIEKAISERRFAYSEQRAVGMAPPPAAPLLRDFPPQIRAAFEAAFTGVGGRPSARVWVSLLTELERGLRRCPASSLHHFATGAPECPWCRMERTLGVQLFLPPMSFDTTGLNVGGGAARLDVNALWRAIEAVKVPASIPPMPALRSILVAATPEAKRARTGFWLRRGFGVALVAGSITLLLVQPSTWLPALIGAFAGWQIFTKFKGPADQIISSAKIKNSRFIEALDRWWERGSSEPFDQLKAQLQANRGELARLPAEEKRRIEEYTRNRRSEQLKVYLQGFQIRRYKIRGVGPSKLATLMSYGVENAFDVSAGRIYNVPGFGPVYTQALLDWRSRIESKFVYDPNTNQIDRMRLASIKSEIRGRDDELRKELQEGQRKLATHSATILSRRSIVEPQLQMLYEQRLQAEADLKLFGQKLPSIPAPKPVPTPKPPPPRPQTYIHGLGTIAPQRTSPTTSTVAVTCPSCGGGMVLRRARRGPRAGSQFWGCRRYPSCRGTRPF